MTQNTSSPEPSLPATLAASRQTNGWTIERQRAFLETLAQCGNVDRAAAAVGMDRSGAYRFRRSTAGRAFDLAWDAALLLARQHMVDDVYELAFEGSVEQIWQDGKLVMEKRRRDPAMLLATIERLGGKAALGSAPVQAVAREFSTFLDAMEADDTDSGECRTGLFMQHRARWADDAQKPMLKDATKILNRAASAGAPSREERPG